MRYAQPATLTFAFWLLLTGSFRPLDLLIGATLSVLLACWSARVLWGDDSPLLTPRQSLRFILYVPVLIKEIILAALGVAELVLDPRMRIDPVIIGHRIALKRDISVVGFTNSITLTPGTLTVDIDGPTAYVHCIHERFADSISSGDLERTMARVFEE